MCSRFHLDSQWNGQKCRRQKRQRKKNEKREIKNNVEYKRKLNLKLIHNTVDSVNSTRAKEEKKNENNFSLMLFAVFVFYGSFLIDEPE